MSVPTRKSAKGKKASNPFVGRWLASDDWSTDTALIITKRGDTLAVRAVDLSDGEEAEIFGLKITKREMSFAAHWSSGQFTKYRLKPLRDAEMEVIFTYTAAVTYKRARKS